MKHHPNLPFWISASFDISTNGSSFLGTFGSGIDLYGMLSISGFGF